MSNVSVYGVGTEPEESVPDRETAFRDLFGSHHRAVSAYVERRAEPDVDPGDVVADTFLVLWRRLETAPTGGECLPWLYGVARRALANHRRTAKNRRRLVDKIARDPTTPVFVPTGTAEEDGTGAVRSALAELRAGDREILQLSVWEALGHAEIAIALDISPNAVAIRLHRARDRLRAELEARTPHDVEDAR